MKHGASGYTNGKCRCDFCTTAHREAAARYTAANRSKVSARDAMWYAANRSHKLVYSKKWQADHPERVTQRERERARSAKGQQRAARRRGVPFTVEALAYIPVIQNDPCVYCGKTGRQTIDHIIPISRGGNGDWGNLAAACLSCNSGKADRSLLAFLLARAS